MSIKNKVIVITGAGSGIGRASAMLLASRGAKLVLGGRRELPIASVAAEIVAAGGEAIALPADVKKRADVEALVSLAVERFGHIDVIVNNAGIGPLSRFDALQIEDWEAMIDVNIKGVLYGIAAVLPHFAGQQSGHVVNVVSTAGLKILPTMGVYAATKNAVRTISEALRQEAGPHLRVTEVSPGMVATDFTSSMTDVAARSAMQAQLDAVAISPDAIARGIAFAIEQPANVDVGSIVIRPTVQG